MPSGEPTYSVWTPEQVKAYVEAIFDEHQRAITEGDNALRHHIEDQVGQIDMALKAADSLEKERIDSLDGRFTTHLDESRRALEMAEREREKAAVALAARLADSIREGDDRLREHIFQQIKQIESALEAARRETSFTHEAAQKAIEKSETAYDKRFDAVNAFREELSDRWALTMPREVADAQMAEIKKSVESITAGIDNRLAQTREDRHNLLPRETFDTAVASLEAKIAANTSRLDRTRGVGEGTDEARGRSQFATSTLISVAVVVVSVIAVIVAIASALAA